MSLDCKLTTFDNPYDPFDVDQFIPWFMFDIEKGYDCCGKLARVANISNDMTQKEIDAEIERAIDLIIKRDFLNIYKKVTKELVETA